MLEVGLELITQDKYGKTKSLYLAFANPNDRNKVYEGIKPYLKGTCKMEEIPISDYTFKWLTGKLSNFDYLMVLNSYAQRSF